MADKNYTHLALVVDRSGSMHYVAEDMVGGITAFFKEQSELGGKCLVDYHQFDSEFETVFSDTLVASAIPKLEPRGTTALLDAIGFTIKDLSDKIKALHENHRPDKVLVIVVTDGYENASREYTKPIIKNMIELQESEFNWDFVFLGANMDAVREGASMGTRGGSTMTFDTSNVSETTGALSGYVVTYRQTGTASFSDEDRDKVVDK